MAIHILTGRPDGSDQLHKSLYGEIWEALKVADLNEKLYLIVPEQYTLGAEHALMAFLNVPGLMGIDVLSLERLADRVFSEVGGKVCQMVDDHGRLMLMAKAVNAVKSQLSLYKKSVGRPGFTAAAAEVVSELKQNQISAETFNAVQKQMDDSTWLGQKLNEMALIYNQYEVELGDDRIDIDGRCVMLCDAIGKSLCLKGAKIWLDGFFTFSANDFAIIEALAGRAADLTITLAGDLDAHVPDAGIFSIIRNTADHFAAMAKETGQSFYITTLSPSSKNVTPMTAVRDQLYSYSPVPWLGDVSGITIARYLNPWEEACCVAKQIALLVRKKHYRYGEIRILCGNIAERGPLLMRALEDFNIPGFCDMVMSIGDDPLIEGLLGALEAVTANYKTDALYAYAKSGYSPLPPEDFALLENYALAKGIKGGRWLHSFEATEMDDGWQTEVLEEYRQTLMAPLISFQSMLKQASNYRDALNATVIFLEMIGAFETLSSLGENLTASGNYEIAGRLRQVWNVLMGVFDQAEKVLGDDPFEAKSYCGILKSGLNGYAIGILPNRPDVVQITDAFRSRGTVTKVLFVVGANEGVLPEELSGYHLLTEEDRKVLSAMDLRLQDDTDFRKNRGDYSIYTQLTAVSEAIALSYTMTDDNGESLLPSELAKGFRKLFPKLPLLSRERLFPDDMVISNGVGFLDEIVYRLRENPKDQKEKKILDWYQHRSEWAYQATKEALSQNYQGVDDRELPSELVNTLYGENLRASVSRVEKFNACPFAHFMRYGIKPSPREEYTINAADIGSLIHSVMEGCFKTATDQNQKLQALSEKDCEVLADRVMDQVLARQENAVFSSSAAYRFGSRKLKRVCRRTMKVLVNQLRRGSFDFDQAEQHFSLPITAQDLPKGIRLAGVVDRIDLFEKNGNTYVKVMDYKTGDRKPDYTEIWYGVSIQLLVYMSASLDFMGNGSGVIPAGTFYFHVDDPLVKEMDADGVEVALNKAFKMNGLFLDDPVVRQALEGNTKENFVYTSGNGLSENDFEALMHYVRFKVEQVVRCILKGEIQVKPLKTIQYDACAFCDYWSICQRDGLIISDVVSPVYRRDEVLEKIRELTEDRKGTVDNGKTMD